MAIHRCLFFAENNKLKVYYYYKENKKFEMLRNKGEDTSIIDGDIWSWWREEISFNSIKDSVDFCFIYDHYYDFIKNFNFKIDTESVWNVNLLSTFFSLFIEYSNIKLVNNENYHEFSKSNNLFEDNSVRQFFTNVKLNNRKEIQTHVSEISPLADYYRTKIEEENK